MTQSRVQALKQMGVDFAEGTNKARSAVEKARTWKECYRIYHIVKADVDRIAEHVDQVNAFCVIPQEFQLSETFLAGDRVLIVAIEAEWMSDVPDLERFKELCLEWKTHCMVELRAQLEKLRGK